MRCTRDPNSLPDSPCTRCVNVGRECIPATANPASFQDRRYRKTRSDARSLEALPHTDAHQTSESTAASSVLSNAPILPSIYSTSPHANNIHQSNNGEGLPKTSTLGTLAENNRSASISNEDTAQLIVMYYPLRFIVSAELTRSKPDFERGFFQQYQFLFHRTT
mgnify:CR=1 FL=1